MYSYDNAFNISCTFHCSCVWLHESRKLKLRTIFSFNKQTVATDYALADLMNYAQQDAPKHI